MKMKKVFFACIAFFFLAATPAYGEVNYDSNGKTGFYGVYEYPEEQPPAKEVLPGTTGASNGSSGGGSAGVQSALPSYEGKGRILPRTGDRSSSFTTIAGIALLAFVGFKLKRGGDLTEKSSHSPRW